MLLLLLACTEDPPDEAPPYEGPLNLVIVLLDDVGVDKLGVYGEHPTPPATPHLDALAAQGRLFRNAWAYSTCSPTRAAVLTGRHPRRTGMGRAILAHDDDYELPLSEVTLPERLMPEGYDASLVGKWHLSSYLSESRFVHPGLQGFPWYSATMENLNASRDEFDRTDGYYHWERDLNGEVDWVDRYVTTQQIDEALERMEAMEPPWMLYLGLSASHSPFSVPPAGSYQIELPPDPGDRALFHATAEAMDLELGRLFQAIDLERTLLVVMGDNGTTEEAVMPPWEPDKAKDSMDEGGLGVPLIVAGAGVTQPGTETAGLVSAVDVWPTVLEWLQIGGSDPNEIDGESFADQLRDPGSPGRELAYSEFFAPFGFGEKRNDVRTVRGERFKLTASDGAGQEALYDLQGRWDDGPNLLLEPSLAPEAEVALTQMREAMQEYRERLVP